jgi:hypothetical protein
VAFNTGNIFGIVDLFSTKRGSKIVRDLVPVRVSTPFDDSIAPMIFSATIKDDSKVHVVGTSIDARELTSI